MKPIVKTLLPKVRKYVLEQRVEGSLSIALSWATIAVDREHRGEIQCCLGILAQEGVLFTRRRPEPVVACYEIGTVDKRFRIRISVDDAKKRLGQMK